jgi:hypothetical protein
MVLSLTSLLFIILPIIAENMTTCEDDDIDMTANHDNQCEFLTPPAAAMVLKADMFDFSSSQCGCFAPCSTTFECWQS